MPSHIAKGQIAQLHFARGGGATFLVRSGEVVFESAAASVVVDGLDHRRTITRQEAAIFAGLDLEALSPAPHPLNPPAPGLHQFDIEITPRSGAPVKLRFYAGVASDLPAASAPILALARWVQLELQRIPQPWAACESAAIPSRRADVA